MSREMLGLSKKMVFALEAVLDIAYNAGPHPVQSRDITARQHIPQRYLEPVCYTHLTLPTSGLV